MTTRAELFSLAREYGDAEFDYGAAIVGENVARRKEAEKRMYETRDALRAALEELTS